MKNLIEMSKQVGTTYSTCKETGEVSYYHIFVIVVCEFKDGTKRKWAIHRRADWQNADMFNHSIETRSFDGESIYETDYRGRIYDSTINFESAIKRIERICKDAYEVRVHTV